MNAKQAKYPQLRFPGFTDAWEQRKLGDILKEFTTKSKTENEHRILSSTNSGMEFRDGRVSGASNLGYKIIKNGDLVLSPQNLWLGNININNIGTGLVSPSYKTFHFINIDSSFINPQLRTQKMLEEYKNSSTQGASVVRRNLELDSFYQIKMFVPTISEQIKIGSFFEQLDHLITLHQRKLAKLKELKQGYLQKMFPKNGSKFPQLRFAGFAGAWEQRKLGEIVEFYSGLTYSPDNVQEKGTFVLRSSNVRNGEIVDADNVYVSHDVVNSSNVQKGDIIVVVRNGSRDLIGKHGQIKHQMGNTVIGAFMTGIRSETPDFTNAMLDTQQFAIEINKNLGATINQITTGSFKKMAFVVPINVEERNAVGAFFRNIDDLITLHQRKLEKLQELKKGYLQKMFC
ncbi:MAG: restriction endonuclease subunit S [Lactobacillus sp.]|nr:MAG: restriction endonuclease subunit S [Lactobacillus sp.]